jgi:hypothetical protein
MDETERKTQPQVWTNVIPEYIPVVCRSGERRSQVVPTHVYSSHQDFVKCPRPSFDRDYIRQRPSYL